MGSFKKIVMKLPQSTSSVLYKTETLEPNEGYVLDIVSAVDVVGF